MPDYLNNQRWAVSALTILYATQETTLLVIHSYSIVN